MTKPTRGELNNPKVTEDNCPHPANKIVPTSVGMRCSVCTKLMGIHQ
jgi:hypothetical protein